MYIYQNSWSSVLFSWTIIIPYTDFSCNSLDIKFFFFFVWGGRGVSAGHPCSAHALPRLLRYAAKRLYELCLGVVLCLTKPAFMRRPWRIKALPGRPWPGISVFLGHNSTVSKQLRYSPARECVCAAGCPALTPLTLWQYFTILDLRFFSYWLVASLTTRCQACVWKLFFGGILRYLMMTINICVRFQIHKI